MKETREIRGKMMEEVVMNEGMKAGMESLYFKALICKMKFADKMRENDGAGVIEVAVIILVLIGLAIVFKDKIHTTLENIFTQYDGKVTELNNIPSHTK